MEQAKNTVVNYTEDQTTQAVQAYLAGTTVEQIANTLGKTVRSVTMKLVREGVYKKAAEPDHQTKITKLGLTQMLEQRFGIAAGALSSLEKGSREALVTLVQAAQNQ